MTLPDILTMATATVGIGAGGGAGFFAIKWLVEFMWGRVDKKEAAVERGFARLDEGTQKLIDRMEKQINALIEGDKIKEKRISDIEKELAECRKRDAESKAEVARLKALMQGYGDARDHAQVIIASERLQDREN